MSLWCSNSPNRSHRLLTSTEILALATGFSLVSGLIFREADEAAAVKHSSLAATLPVQTFLWSAGAMLVLFPAAWYYESYYAPLQATLGR